MAMNPMAVLTVIFGLLVLIAPWATSGATLQYLESVLGVLVIIMGALAMKK